MTSSKLNYLLKAMPSNTITLGLQPVNLGERQTALPLSFLVFDLAGLYKPLAQGSAHHIVNM